MTHDELKELAPHGWEETTLNAVPDTSAFLCVPGEGGVNTFYIPAKPKPREWEGTVKELVNSLLDNPINWGSNTRIKVVEVL